MTSSGTAICTGDTERFVWVLERSRTASSAQSRFRFTGVIQLPHFGGSSKQQMHGDLMNDFPGKIVLCLTWCHIMTPGRCQGADREHPSLRCRWGGKKMKCRFADSLEVFWQMKGTRKSQDPATFTQICILQVQMRQSDFFVWLSNG